MVQSVGPIASWARFAYLVLAWLFVACLVAQLFLAGLGVFRSGADFAVHGEFGRTFGWLAILSPLVALVARLPRWFPLLGLVVFILFVVQSVLVFIRADLPEVAALHPVNGVIIIGLALRLALDARAYVPPPLGTAASIATPAETR
jgi:hypothetical protein